MRNKDKLFLLILIVPLISFSQTKRLNRDIIWTGVEQVQVAENETIQFIRFDGSSNDFENGLLPMYYERIALQDAEHFQSIEVVNKIFEPLTPAEIEIIGSSTRINSELHIESGLAFDRKEPFATLSFIPIQKNELTGFYERLVSFDIDIIFDQNLAGNNNYKSATYKSNSVLSSGNWYKVAVNNTGVYKLSYDNLSELGMDVNSINPKHIRVYGNGGGMLSENVNVFRYDDLQENAIKVTGEEDGSFDSGDYVLFYAESPNEWEYSPNDGRMYKNVHL